MPLPSRLIIMYPITDHTSQEREQPPAPSGPTSTAEFDHSTMLNLPEPQNSTPASVPQVLLRTDPHLHLNTRRANYDMNFAGGRIRQMWTEDVFLQPFIVSDMDSYPGTLLKLVHDSPPSTQRSCQRCSCSILRWRSIDGRTRGL